MFQTKDQDKNLQEQLNEVEMDNLAGKDFNDSKDDPRFQKKNGGTCRKDTRNVCLTKT